MLDQSPDLMWINQKIIKKEICSFVCDQNPLNKSKQDDTKDIRIIIFGNKFSLALFYWVLPFEKYNIREFLLWNLQLDFDVLEYQLGVISVSFSIIKIGVISRFQKLYWNFSAPSTSSEVNNSYIFPVIKFSLFSFFDYQ